MSTISDILEKYKESLQASSERQSHLYASRSSNVTNFYNTFMKNLIRTYPMEDGTLEKKAVEFCTNYFGREDPSFLAVDGTCDKYRLEEFAVFFAASYGITGRFHSAGVNKLEYTRRSLKDDISMVAYVPVPFAEMAEPTEDMGFGDDMRFNTSDIHNKLMLLAEVYLIFKEMSSGSHPNIVLWDQSFSQTLHWTAPNLKDIPIIKNRYEYEGRALTYWDALIARSHPYNADLDMPSTKGGYFNMPNRIIYELMESEDNECSIEYLSNLFGEPREEILRIIKKFLIKKEPWETEDMVALTQSDKILKLNKQYSDSWQVIVNFASSVCEELFYEKNPHALLYSGRWMSIDDINMILNVLLRRICELAWEKNILLIGIVKDSSSKYFIRNYLGVTQIQGIYQGYTLEDLMSLLWTDRLTFEYALESDPSLFAPVSTIEYDSIFLTVFPSTKTVAAGGNPDIFIRPVPSPERLFAKSMSLYYLKRKRNKAIFNHALFIDRLILPSFDGNKCGSVKIRPKVDDKHIIIEPFFDGSKDDENIVYDFINFFIYHSTTNKYAEVIGYPEPLHKADWGAKTFNRKMAQRMIRNSASILKRRKPWQLSIRSRRGSRR